MIPVTPEGGKAARANAVAPSIEAGNVYLPHPALFPWVADFIERAAAFPQVAHDDEIDAMTQALLRLKRHDIAWPKEEAHPVAEEETWNTLLQDLGVEPGEQEVALGW